MRAFVALEVSGEVADALLGFQNELAATGADVKLVERENLHINLKFLGEISGAQAAEAMTRLEKISAKDSRIDVQGAGAFPALSRPRVVWAGVASDKDARVGLIAQQVLHLLLEIGERDDRPFRPHITLGRVRSFRNVGELSRLLKENSERRFGTMSLSEVKLKSSVLTPAGPVYKDLGVYGLG